MPAERRACSQQRADRLCERQKTKPGTAHFSGTFSRELHSVNVLRGTTGVRRAARCHISLSSHLPDIPAHLRTRGKTGFPERGSQARGSRPPAPFVVTRKETLNYFPLKQRPSLFPDAMLWRRCKNIPWLPEPVQAASRRAKLRLYGLQKSLPE